MAVEEVPGPAAIRRALAECMTLTDIDDAMEWAPGTARRRRWRAPQRGGLPPSDAELGGVAIWFRTTIETWRTHQPAPPATAPPATPEAGLDTVPTTPEPPVMARDAPPVPGASQDSGDRAADVTLDEAGTGATATGDVDAATPDLDRELDPPDLVPSDEHGDVDTLDDRDDADDSNADDGNADDGEVDARVDDLASDPGEIAELAGAAVVVGSGFALAQGQQVLANVHGQWRWAQVQHRDRGTVVVEYRVGAGRLGQRRQRVDIDRVRILADT